MALPFTEPVLGSAAGSSGQRHRRQPVVVLGEALPFHDPRFWCSSYPRLSRGPPEWEWRGYTEQNGLAGWLLGGGCEVVFSSHYALTRMDAAARPAIARLPLPEGAFETSLWLRRV